MEKKNKGLQSVFRKMESKSLGVWDLFLVGGGDGVL